MAAGVGSHSSRECDIELKDICLRDFSFIETSLFMGTSHSGWETLSPSAGKGFSNMYNQEKEFYVEFFKNFYKSTNNTIF